MIVKHIHRALEAKSVAHQRKIEELGQTAEQSLSNYVCVLDDTPQINGIHTILQDVKTNREDFIFYFDRLATLIIEKFVSHLFPPFFSSFKSSKLGLTLFILNIKSTRSSRIYT